MKSVVRFEITKEMVSKGIDTSITVRRNVWDIKLEDGKLQCSDLLNSQFNFVMEEQGGFIFLCEKYVYFRNRNFQMQLDSLLIDKVVRVINPEDFVLELTTGVLDLDKSFELYCDSNISVTKVRNINEGKPYWTQKYSVRFNNSTKLALVYAKNSKFAYSIFYYWGWSPHEALTSIIKEGKLPNPVLTSR